MSTIIIKSAPVVVALWLMLAVVSSVQETGEGDEDLSEAGWQAFKARYGKSYSDPTADGFRYC